MPRGTQSCFWLFTENDQPETFREAIQRLEQSEENITYICGQLERGTHLHFQGYLQLKVAKAVSWLKNNISPTAHFEVQYKDAPADRGRHYASKPHIPCEYDCDECRKEIANPTKIPDTFVEYGTIRKKGEGAGKRTDLDGLVKAIKEGQTQRQIIENPELNHTFANHMQYHDRVKMLYRPPNLESVDVRLYVGVTGAGKTILAMGEDEDFYDVPINNGTLWFDGYDQNKVIIFDDFAGKVDHQTLVSTLKLFDRYARRIPIKGSFTWLRSPIVIVTSNLHPRFWYDWKEREKSYAALRRRFKKVIVFEEPQDEVFHQEILETEEDIERYFYDKDQWPTEPEPQQF